MIKITSLTNQYIKSLMELKKNKVKKETNQFLVDGKDFIDFAYEKGLLKTLLTLDYLPEYEEVEQVIVTQAILDKLSPNINASSMLGVCNYPKQNEVTGDRLVYLDGVQDPGNVGTIIRTALAFSYSGVILSEDSASIYNDKLISATKGAIFTFPIYTNVKLADLKKQGYQLIATALKNSVDYKSVKVNEKFVLIMGSEGQGIKEETYNIADHIVKIDMDHIDSLNVGVACGILLNEYRK